MVKKALLVFFIFSLIFSFLLEGDTYLSLGNDASVVGLLTYRQVYEKSFLNDPVLSNTYFRYIPSHLMIVKTLLSATDSYLLTLKILLFFQVFLTLISNFVLISRLFNRLSYIQAMLCSFLVGIPFLILPFGESVGFGGIGYVEARNTFGIITPLVLLYYWRNSSIQIFNRNVPNIIVIAFCLGLLVHLHPLCGANMFAVIFVHWAIFRSRRIKDRWTIIWAVFLFLATSAPFVFPYVIGEFSRNQELLSNEFAQYLLISRQVRGEVLWLLKLTYIPFCTILVLMVFVFRRTVCVKLEYKTDFYFLKTMFMVAFTVEIIGALLYGHVFSFLSNVSKLSITLIRTERFTMYIVELIVIFVMANGKELLAFDRGDAEQSRYRK